MKLHLPTRGLLVLLMMCLACTQIWAQTQSVTGKITDSKTGKPLQGVTVKVKNGTTAAITDDDGTYTINVPSSSATLSFTHTGYPVHEERVGSRTSINFSIAPIENNLDEVVVVGYGSQNKKEITGAMVSIDTKKIQELPVASLSEMLRGQVPGLNVTGGAQRPGTLAAINIRQQFNWGKDNGGTTPLIVIDDVIQVDPLTGLPSSDRFNMLDLSEIESITVIKDAAAAIYGSRGSQGAVVVKTKRGKIGAPHVTYSAKFETNNAVSHGKVMNARQYGEFSNKFIQGQSGYIPDWKFSDAELASMDSLNYDWLANDWRAAGTMQHSIDLGGGSERATYFMGASYYTQGANLGNQNFNRWTYRAGTDVKLLAGLRFSATLAAANTNITKSFTKVNFSDGFASGGEQNDYAVLLHMPKYIPWQYNVNGTTQYISPSLGPTRVGAVNSNTALSNWNYYSLLNNGSQTNNKNFNYNVNLSLQYDVPFIKGLSFKLNYGLSQVATNNEQDLFAQLLAQATKMNVAGKHLYAETPAADWALTLNKTSSRVSYENITSKNEQSNFFVTYDRKFGDHSISAMVSAEKATNTGDDRIQLYDNPIPGVYNGTSASAGTLNTSNSITYRYSGGSLSYLGRLSYNYKSKYLLQFVFRTDASTVFAPENYWGRFPAISAGWVVSDEKFFRDVRWVNFLKIRANVGKTGNNNIKPWKWLQLYDWAADKGLSFGTNGGIYTYGLTPGVTPNRNVKWDNTTQRNFGLDMGFLKNRLTVTFDQYFNSTRNMLTDMSAALLSPISVGGAFAEQNYAGVDFWGTEISATWKDHIGKDFTYSVGINTSFNNYKTVTYFDQAFAYPSTTTTRRAVGNYGITPVWGFRTWKQTSGGDGMLRTDADIDNYWQYLTDNATKSGVAGAVPSFFGSTTKATALKKGMLVYEDVAGNLDATNKTIAGPNGRIATSEDYVKLKKSNQTYGFITNLSFGWKGISMLAQIATSWGGANYLDYVKQATSSTSASWSQPIYLKDMYDSATNPNGKYPNLVYYDNFGGATSDFFLLPTFRMFVRSLSVGYTIPTALVKKIKFESAKLFLSGNNLWDFYNPYPDKYRNMYDDPKVAYPTLRTWAVGLNVGF